MKEVKMGDAVNNTDKINITVFPQLPSTTITELKENVTKIDIGEPVTIPDNRISSAAWGQSTNRNNQNSQNTQNVYYPDPSYTQGQTPAYQQRLDGQPVYIMTSNPPPPQNVSRGGASHRENDPNEPRSELYRNSQIFTDSFNTVKIRNRFVQRVYTILSTQLFFTFMFILLACLEINTKKFFQKYGLVFLIVFAILFFSIYIALVCCVDLRRKVPTNFILLGLLTLSMTMLMVVATVHYHTMIVLYAMGTTALLCFLVSIFACQTKWDITGCGMCLCIASMALMVFGLIIMIMFLCGQNVELLNLIYSFIAVFLFSLWLMYDTQMIVGGRRIELSPEEYIFGALCLYIDIMQIFMHLLVIYEYFCRG